MSRVRDLASILTASSVLGTDVEVATAVSNHSALTATHGVSGAIVGTTETQTLTNKTLTSPALTTPTISTATTNGDILYGTGSGALARLGIGTTSQVLNVSGGVPAWTTPSTGSMTLISTTSFSGATTANIDNIFSSNYTAYKVILSRWNTSGGNCVFKLRYGSNTQSTNYYGLATGINSNGTSQSTLSSGATSFGAGFDNQTGSGVLELTFLDVGTSAIQPMWHGIWNGHANYLQLVGGQINANWQTYTGIQFLSASGNVSGTVSVYGLAR